MRSSRALSVVLAMGLVVFSAVPRASAEGSKLSNTGSLNELRIGGMAGGFHRDSGHRVYQGLGFGGQIGGDLYGILGSGDSYGILVISTDLLTLGSGEPDAGMFGQSAVDVGAGTRVEWSGGAFQAWAGWHMFYDSLGVNPDDPNELTLFEHGLLARTRLYLGAFAIEAGYAGFLDDTDYILLGVRLRASESVSLGSTASAHLLAESTDDGVIDYGRRMWIANLFVAFHP